MADAMVTARMSEEKKRAGAMVLENLGLNASQAISLFYERLIQDQDISFLNVPNKKPSREDWEKAAAFVDSLPVKRESPLFDLPIGEIKLRRFEAREKRACHE